MTKIKYLSYSTHNRMYLIKIGYSLITFLIFGFNT